MWGVVLDDATEPELDLDQEVGKLGQSVSEMGAVLYIDRYQSGIDHFLIDLGSGLVNWY